MTNLAASRLPSLPGPAAWNAILGPAPDYASLSGMQTADVVVSGAGFAGLSAARRLRQMITRSKSLCWRRAASPKARLEETPAS